MILVLAGNKEEFDKFLEKHISKTFFVSKNKGARHF